MCQAHERRLPHRQPFGTDRASHEPTPAAVSPLNAAAGADGATRNTRGSRRGAGCEMYFSKKQDRPPDGPLSPPPRALDPGPLELNNPKLPHRSLIDLSVKMTGDLWSDGDVQVDGQLCGNIYCAQLIVGKDAVVTGAIIAQEAVIRGRMIGIIRAMRVLLQDTARVESEIIYRSLSIEEGARFEGVASPRLDPLDLNPLDADIGVSPMAELRQSVARVGAGTPNGAAPGAVAQAVVPTGAHTGAQTGAQTSAKRTQRSAAGAEVTAADALSAAGWHLNGPGGEP
jgi:cytoskeletal protein CcmA (bactofilin family)